MSNVCQVTGKRPHRGKQVSFSHKRSGRWFKPNVQRKRFWLANENRWVTLDVSTTGLKTINRRGIESVVADLRKSGQKI